MALSTDKKIIKSFFLKYQNELLVRAKTVGLMNHASTNGALKEFLVKSVLELMLPSSCSVVSGKVFDGKGNESRQIDLIIYDNRVPKFEISKGIGYYPIEGVIASIEVKSKLSKKDIHEALDNCYSLLKLSPIVYGGCKIVKDNNWKAPVGLQEERRAAYEYLVGTYIFSFDSVSISTASNHVEDWIGKNSIIDINVALMPRCILGKKWIGLLEDAYITFPSAELKKSATGNGMVFIKTDNYFMYFMSHLLHKVSNRIKAEHGVNESYFSINKILPVSEEIINDQIKTDSGLRYLLF